MASKPDPRRGHPDRRGKNGPGAHPAKEAHRKFRPPTASSGARQVVAVAGGLALLLFSLLILSGITIPASIFWVFVAAAAVFAFNHPEVTLYALLGNALIGLTHIAGLPRIGPLSVPMAFEAVLVLAIAYRIIFKGQKLFIASPQHLLLLGLSVWMILSLLFNGQVGPENLSAVRNLFLVRLLVFLVLTNILLTETALKRFVVVLMLCNAGLLATSFMVRMGLFGEEMLNFADYILRTSGFVHNPNTLAFDLTTMLIFSFAAFLYVKSPRLKTALAILAILDFVGVLTTISRSGFVSLCCVVIFLIWKLRRNVWVFAGLVVMVLLALVLVPGGLGFRFSRVNEIQDVDRLSFARVALNTSVHNPVFGVGYGNYLASFDRYNNTALEERHPPHNMYMDLSAQMGFPALALYLLVFVFLIRRLRQMEKELEAAGERGSFNYQFGWAVQAFIVNLAVFGLSGDVQFEYSVFTILGFGMLLYRRHREASGPGFLPPGWPPGRALPERPGRG